MRALPSVVMARRIFELLIFIVLSGGFSVGVIDRIEKGRATVDYGWFTTQVAVEELDLVERVKRDKK